ncbi:MAG: SAM-dependent methyltransferase [Candidatus Krumholzibacteriota bacterium]|nr:SAM-dependent methyltransferase [Candidatus Krumholzibacteriota bacterium]
MALDIPQKALSIVACPVCKGGLDEAAGGLACRACARVYPVRGGIPELFVPDTGPSIDPGSLRIKTDGEAARTIAEMAAIDTGFIRSQRAFYGLYFLLVLSAAMKWVPAAIAVLAIFAADWVWFRASRGRVLRRYASNPLRLRTAADYRAVDDAYAREGRAQPGMSDWVRLARRALGDSGTGALGATAAEPPDGAGGSSKGGEYGEATGDPDDERYRDIHRVWRGAEKPGGVVVDVGANDGCAYTKFGIGKDATFVGIDVSRTLLETLRADAPDQTAIQADGACLPLLDGTADFLFCTETLEHIADPQAAIAEFVRVLKPGGRLMIQSPNAHRIRNLNLIHLIELFASLLTDRGLLKKVVHENTWHNGVTYHWDFSKQDYRRLLEGRPCRVTALYSRSFFFPGFLVRGRIERFRRKERVLGKLPVIRLLGGDLVVVAEKNRT